MNVKSLKIGFASCLHQDLLNHSTPLFESMTREHFSIFVWLGDVGYYDVQETPVFGKFEAASLRDMRNGLSKIKDFPPYKKFAKSTLVTGIWDDHDYGLNNGDSSLVFKSERREIFLDFIGNDGLTRKEGLFGSIQSGKVLLVLLDLRFFKEGEDLLGEDQWFWFEETLRSSNSSKVLIFSSIQFLPTHRPFVESWIRFPKSRKRMVDILKSHRQKQFLILSGDVHFAEMGCGNLGEDQNVFEITSSGLTHSWGHNECFGLLGIVEYVRSEEEAVFFDFFDMRSYASLATRIAVKLIASHWPSFYGMPQKQDSMIFPFSWLGRLVSMLLDWNGNEHSLMGESSYFGLNYGVVIFDEKSNYLTVEVKDSKGVNVLKWDEKQKVRCNEIKF